MCQDISRDQKGLRSGSWGWQSCYLIHKSPESGGSSLGHHLVVEELLFNAYFIGSEEAVSSKGWI